jgi:hypothetical protein
VADPAWPPAAVGRQRRSGRRTVRRHRNAATSCHRSPQRHGGPLYAGPCRKVEQPHPGGLRCHPARAVGGRVCANTTYPMGVHPEGYEGGDASSSPLTTGTCPRSLWRRNDTRRTTANHDRQPARRNALSSTQRATVPDTTRADDELLTMQEVADVVRVPVATPRYWRHPRHRPAQLPHRPQRPLLAHGSLRLARRPGQWATARASSDIMPLADVAPVSDRLDGRPDQLGQFISAAAVELMRRGEDGQR